MGDLSNIAKPMEESNRKSEMRKCKVDKCFKRSFTRSGSNPKRRKMRNNILGISNRL
jgi:hypothetical protein